MNRKIKIIGAAALIALSLIFLFLYNLNSGNPYEWILEAEYDVIYDFIDGKACVEKGDERWMIHSDGTLTEIDIDRDYDYLKNTITKTKSSANANNKELYGVKNLLGETILEEKYEHISYSSNGSIVAIESKSELLFLFFDSEGVLVAEMDRRIDPDVMFAFVRPYSEDYAAFHEDFRCGFLNSSGEVVIEAQYVEVGDFKNGYAGVLKTVPTDTPGTSKYQWGLIDRSGNYIIDCEYTCLGDYSDGLIAFSDDKDIGYMDINGDVVIQPQYANGSDFTDGIAYVIPKSFFNMPVTDLNQVGAPYYLIDKNNNRLYSFRKEKGFGFIDMQDNFIYVMSIPNEKIGLIKNPVLSDAAGD